MNYRKTLEDCSLAELAMIWREKNWLTVAEQSCPGLSIAVDILLNGKTTDKYAALDTSGFFDYKGKPIFTFKGGLGEPLGLVPETPNWNKMS